MTNLKAKLNGKKGFTLIEMLVVIAIIAVLVAIIIPTVTSATSKAAAATNAANLRSLKAEIVTSYLANEGKVTVDDSNAVTVSGITGPAMKKIGTDVDDCDAGETINGEDALFTVTYDGSDFTVKYAGKTIEEFARYADTGSYEAEDD